MKRSDHAPKTKASVDAVRCNLEMALLLLDDLPDGYEELGLAKALVNDALLASLRLSLEIALQVSPLNPPNLKLVYVQDQAS